jgi:hypothetical protein
MILPVVPYGCETWSLALREEHRLGVFEDRVLIRGMKWREGGEICLAMSFVICTLLAKYSQNDEVEEDEIGVACSKKGWEEECV